MLNVFKVNGKNITAMPLSPSYRNQSIDLQSKSSDCFLYDINIDVVLWSLFLIVTTFGASNVFIIDFDQILTWWNILTTFLLTLNMSLFYG